MEENNFKILDGKYALLKTIGNGSTCKIKLAKEIETGFKFAIKILKNESIFNSNEKMFESEISMLKKINHPHIINIKDASKGLIKKPNETHKIVHFIVLEMAENGELFDYLSFTRKGFGENYGRFLFKELIEGIRACHIAGVVHRDLKTENIMLSNDWSLKIADFGFATLLAGKDKTGKLNTSLGTQGYAAPEIIARQSYFGSCADIFSCGVILFLLVTGNLPFAKNASANDPYYRNFVDKNYEHFWNMIELKKINVTNDFKSLVTLMLSYDPAQRPTINEVINHPWYLSDCVTKDQMRKEFEKRKNIVNQLRIKESIMIKNQKKESVNRVVKPGIYKGSIIDDGEKDFNDILELSLNRNIDYFIDNQNPYTIMTNLTVANDLLVGIYRYFMENDERKKTVKVSQYSYSIEIFYGLDHDTLNYIEDLEFQALKVKVIIKKTESDNLIIEFRKIQGEKEEFYDLYDKFANCKEYKF